MKPVRPRLLHTWILPAFAAVAAATWCDAAGAGEGTGPLPAPPPPRAFGVYIRDRLAGYYGEARTFSFQEDRLAEVLFTRSVLNTGPGGPDLRDGLFWIDPAGGRVRRARLSLRGRGRSLRVEVRVEEGRAVLRIIEGNGKERTRTVDLPDGALTACSPAAAARILLGPGAPEEEARVRLFDPFEGTVRSVRVKRLGEAPPPGEEGKEALRFSLVESAFRRTVTLWTDRAGRLLCFEDPARGIAYRAAGPKAMEKLGLRAVPNPAYLAVSAACDRPLALSWMEVKARLRVEGGVDLEGLHTPWQSFRGEVEPGVVEGVFRVRGYLYGESRPAPAEGGGVPPGPGDLRSGEGIPVGAPEIRTLAVRAAEGLKEGRHVAHALGRWMIRNLAFDPFGGADARAVLRLGRGNALGLARLYAALCRSRGIPCRITGGAKYVRADGGGGFMAHTWNEVYLEETGTWIPVDLASGRVSLFDAGHLRLGPGAALAGGTASVRAWIPAGEGCRPPPPRVRPAPFPLAPGASCTYGLSVNGRRVGTERVTFEGTETRAGGAAFRFRTEAETGKTKIRSETVADAAGGLLFHEVHRRDPRGEESVRTLEREGNEVRVRIVKGGKSEGREIALPPGGLFMDTDAVFPLGFLLSRLEIEEGDAVPVTLLHAGTLQVLEVQVACLGRAPVPAAGTTVEGRLFEVRSAFQCIYAWLDDRGLLVRESEQGGASVTALEKAYPPRGGSGPRKEGKQDEHQGASREEQGVRDEVPEGAQDPPGEHGDVAALLLSVHEVGHADGAEQEGEPELCFRIHGGSFSMKARR